MQDVGQITQVRPFERPARMNGTNKCKSCFLVNHQSLRNRKQVGGRIDATHAINISNRRRTTVRVRVAVLFLYFKAQVAIASTLPRRIRNVQRAPVTLQRLSVNTLQGLLRRCTRTETRERSTCAVRSSWSCPDIRASHTVASVKNVKDAPRAGCPAAVASFSTCMHMHIGRGDLSRQHQTLGAQPRWATDTKEYLRRHINHASARWSVGDA